MVSGFLHKLSENQFFNIYYPTDFDERHCRRIGIWNNIPVSGNQFRKQQRIHFLPEYPHTLEINSRIDVLFYSNIVV